MANGMKITMLGPSGIGKTCFMTGMFGIMQVGYDGFTLRTTDHDDGVRLNMDWERMLGETGPNRFPPLTPDTPTYYDFRFCYAFNPIMDFTWLDYRGGALSDRKEAASVAELEQHLLSSSCVFVCISAEHLIEPISAANLPRVHVKARLNYINEYLGKLREGINPSAAKPFPVVVMITKYDLLLDPSRTKTLRPKEAIYNDLKTLFRPLFSKDSGFLVMVSKVSLGPDLRNSLTDGAIDPKNVHKPIIFAIHCYTQELVATHANELKNKLRDKATEAEKGWLRRKAEELFAGDGKETAEERDKRIRYIRQNIEQLKDNLSLLTRHLEGEGFFLSGEEWELQFD